MIPKKIHYCWFGTNEKTERVKRCMRSWKIYLSDYEIIEWNESNYDVNANAFSKEAYAQKKWAFVSDCARIDALLENGGIYLDTDVEVLKPFDDLLDNGAFLGFESNDFLATSVMGACSHHPFFRELSDYYAKERFVMEDGSINDKPNPYLFTNYLQRHGLERTGKEQIVDNIRVYPQVYFAPNTFSMIWNRIPRSSYAIHHYEQSWRDEEKREFNTIIQKVRRYAVGVGRNMIGTSKLYELKHSRH